MEESIIYINTAYNNQATLDSTLDSTIDEFGSVTWRELLTDILSKDIDDPDTLEFLDDRGLSEANLDDLIDSDTIDKFYDELAFYEDNYSGPRACLFEFLIKAEIFTTDINGNYYGNGIELIQTTANGPEKLVYVEDDDAAQLLKNLLDKKGIKVEFVKV